jgi:hypothetical protein
MYNKINRHLVVKINYVGQGVGKLEYWLWKGVALVVMDRVR